MLTALLFDIFFLMVVLLSLSDSFQIQHTTKKDDKIK